MELAYSLAERTLSGLKLGAAAIGGAILLTHMFPEGGTEPFVANSFRPAIAMAIAVLILIPREEKLLRYGVAAYALALTAAFLVDSPMGGNATRMGSLILGPALAVGAWQQRRLAIALVAPLLLIWQWSPVVRDLESVRAEASVEADYYSSVRTFLLEDMKQTGERYRVEVLPVESHWEAAHIPRGIYIARGWERQLDRKLNALFYEDEAGPLTPTAYRSWLDELAVGYVAIPHTELDYAGKAEARLISQGGVPYLKRAFVNPDWTVYRVQDPRPLAQGVGEMVKMKPDGFVVRADSAGTVLVQVRWTRYWKINGGLRLRRGVRNGDDARRRGRARVDQGRR